MTRGVISHPPDWQRAARALQRRVAGEQEIGRRVRGLADALLGKPYVADSLIGGPAEPERLVIQLTAFDCVTLVETVLALGRTRSATAFARELRQLRYRDGKVIWRSRLHYFSNWLRANHRRGAVRIRTRGAGSRAIDATLGCVEGIAERRVRFHVVPKRALGSARPRIADGAVVAFASVRARLDFFHTGLVFDDGPGGLILIHASRRDGVVVAELLVDFLARNRLRGIAFASPLG